MEKGRRGDYLSGSGKVATVSYIRRPGRRLSVRTNVEKNRVLCQPLYRLSRQGTVGTLPLPLSKMSIAPS